jgi:hypothetical protein
MHLDHTPWRLVSVAALCSVFVVGCGSSSHNPGSSAALQSHAFAADAYKYAACMRKHGVPNFPDPKVSSGPNGGVQVAIVVGAPNGVNPKSPAVAAAGKDCQGILPGPQSSSQNAAQEHQHALDVLSFAQCLRAHGLTDFPDPNAQGRLTVQMITAAGIDLHAPQTLTAAKACIGASHGAITPADVEQAVNGAQR